MKLFGLNFDEESIFTITDNVAIYANDDERRLGVTKSPQDSIGEIRTVCFKPIETISTRGSITDMSKGYRPLGSYITGLHPGCSTYTRGYTKDQIQSITKFLDEFIVKPFEESNAAIGILNHGNHDFWSKYRVRLYTGRDFNMMNPIDRLDLWLSCLHGKVVTPLSVGTAISLECPYKVEDYDESRNAEEDLLLQKDEARKVVDGIIDNDPDLFVAMLRYKGILNPSIDVDNKFLRVTAVKMFDNKIAGLSTEKVIELVNEAKTEEGKGLIMWYSGVLNLINHRLIEERDGRYLYKNVNLGYNIKEVARKISDNLSDLAPKVRAELQDELQKIYLER